jgi:serine/threonine-protein kinase
MNTRDQFGNYLLLKRLGEDALGETFRAGRIAQQALERVVLLRVLNGQGFDAEKIARALQARAGLGQALKSPNIGGAVDVGQVRGVPYIAYDFTSGRTLAQLLEQAARRNSALPLDHALLIAERLALGLAVAFETRFGSDRVGHGFVTPGFVYVSNEGELHLVGFEASTGLRDSAAHPLVKQAVGRYLAPETVAGQPPSRADDVYSVGALLFEMLTGQQVPMMPVAGLGPVLDQAVLAAESTALPPEILALLQQTLCPRDQRVPDIVTWHKSLSKLMADADYSATTFNLAFFLHNLFREEIEREGKELESERSQAEAMIASAPAEPAAEATEAGAQAASAGEPVREDTAVLRDAYGLPKKKGSNTGVMIGAAVGAAAILATVGYFVIGRGGTVDEAPPPAVAEPQQAAPVTQPVEEEVAEPQPTGMTPEEIQALIDQALSAQREQLQAGLKAQSDEQLAALRRQPDEAQKAPAAPKPVSPSAARIESLPAESAPSRAQQAAQTPAPAPQRPAPQAAAPRPAAPQTTTPPRTQPAPTRSAPVTRAPTTPRPAPATAGVRVGELVTPGPGVVAPRVVRAPALKYPQMARRMKREAAVSVRVLVDENGRAADVRATGAKAGFGMDQAAMDYARECLWEPAKKNGVKVKMWYDMKVTFTLSGGR